jgi:hypothetical protein
MSNKKNKIKRREWIENAVHALEDFLRKKDPLLELEIHVDFTDSDDGSFTLSCSSTVWPTRGRALHETPDEEGIFIVSFWEVDLYVLLEIPPDEFFVFNWGLFPLIESRRFFRELQNSSFISHLPLFRAAGEKIF